MTIGTMEDFHGKSFDGFTVEVDAEQQRPPPDLSEPRAMHIARPQGGLVLWVVSVTGHAVPVACLGVGAVRRITRALDLDRQGHAVRVT